MGWIYLLIAGIFEMGWPLGMKISQTTNYKTLGISMAVVFMILSGIFLWYAQKTIPIGTAYAVWTGIGAVGTFLIGIIIFKDPTNFFRIISVFLIIAGIVGLKLSH